MSTIWHLNRAEGCLKAILLRNHACAVRKSRMNHRNFRVFACLVVSILVSITALKIEASPYGPLKPVTLFIGSFGKPYGVSQAFTKWDDVLKQYPDLASSLNLDGESLFSYFRHGGTNAIVVSTDNLKWSLVNFEAQILETRFDFAVVPSLALLPAADFGVASDALAKAIDPRRAVFIFDLPTSGKPDDHASLLQTWSSKKLSRAAAFAPALKTTSGGLVPPGAAMAALMSRVDHDIGPWKSPSGTMFRLQGDDTLSFSPSEAQCTRWISNLPSGVNCLRVHQNRVISWGGRLMPIGDPDNRYLSIRRAHDYFDRETEESLRWLNSATAGDVACAKAIAQLEWQLYAHWQLKALVGAQQNEAFYVRCGVGQTMTNADLRAGRTIVEFGIALLRPSEFTVIRHVFERKP